MALIEVSSHLQGESSTIVSAGVRFSASAICRGKAAAAQPLPPDEETIPPTEPEPQEPQQP